MSAHTIINSARGPRPAVSDFGLKRQPTNWESKDTSFIDSYLVHASMQDTPRSAPAPSIPQWSTFKITQPQRQSGPRLFNGYAVCPSHNAYLTFCVQLTNSDATQRYTKMRYRDMIVDNYVSACLSSTHLSQLRWLGVSNILNTASRETFQRIFRISHRDIRSRGSVEIFSKLHLRSDYPSYKEFRKLLLADPFTRGVIALLKHHAKALGRASVKRFIFLSEGFEGSGEPSALELRLNLVVELMRSGDPVSI